MKKNTNQKILQMTELAMLVALVVVLQIFGGFIKFGPFSLSLVLIPVVIGSILLGPKGGAILGAAFGLVVVIQCAMGIDAGGFILWGINPVFTALICMVKGTAAGLVPGLLYNLINRKKALDGMHIVGAVVAAISAPVVNTGLFLIGLSSLFNTTLVEWAGGTNVMVYIITGLVGINFLIELVVNIVISPAISTIVKAVSKQVK